MENEQARGQTPGNNPKKFESDSQKVVHKHLEDFNHTISEEDIRNVRVGMTPPDAAKDPKALNKEIEQKVADITRDMESNRDDEETPRDQPINPWDIIT